MTKRRDQLSAAWMALILAIILIFGCVVACNAMKRRLRDLADYALRGRHSASSAQHP